MVQAFEQRPQDHLADRLLDALRAGAAAGGEEGPVRSCGLLVVDRVTWPVTDLRVDWHDDPVTELARLWAVWRPQEADYVQRALDPRRAGLRGPGRRMTKEQGEWSCLLDDVVYDRRTTFIVRLRHAT